MVNVTAAQDNGTVMFRTLPPATGYRIPTREELTALRRIVFVTHPELIAGDEIEFLRAFGPKEDFSGYH